MSKQMLPAHVREMHRNRDKGFETEFGVRTCICHLNSIKTTLCNHCYTSCINADFQTEVHVIN